MKSAKGVVSMIGRGKSRDPIEESIEKILIALGEDPKREGLLRTPERGEKALRFLTSGYEANIEEIVNLIVGRKFQSVSAGARPADGARP